MPKAPCAVAPEPAPIRSNRFDRRFTSHVSQETYKRLAQIANVNRRRISEQVRVWVEENVERESEPRFIPVGRVPFAIDSNTR